MRDTQLSGSRIRERRLALGLKQSQLANSVNISASYLNLIEHNRRRIAGKLLNDLARCLNIDSELLDEGASQKLVSTLQQIAAEDTQNRSLGSVYQLVAKFPGWADRLVDLHI